MVTGHLGRIFGRTGHGDLAHTNKERARPVDRFSTRSDIDWRRYLLRRLVNTSPGLVDGHHCFFEKYLQPDVHSLLTWRPVPLAKRICDEGAVEGFGLVRCGVCQSERRGSWSSNLPTKGAGQPRNCPFRIRRAWFVKQTCRSGRSLTDDGHSSCRSNGKNDCGKW